MTFNTKDSQTKELVKRAEHILLAIEMQPNRRGKLDVLLHVLAERDTAVREAIHELSNRTAIQAGEMLARTTNPTKEPL